MAGSISLLVDSPLADLAFLMGGVPTDVKRQIGRATKAAAEPIWTSELAQSPGAITLLRQKVLVGSAQVSATAQNVTLISGGKGKLNSGTPVSVLAFAAEFGIGASKVITQKSSKGKPYKRRAGNAFGLPRSGGYVVYKAGSEAIPRFASLWIQTAWRCIYEAEEKAKN